LSRYGIALVAVLALALYLARALDGMLDGNERVGRLS